MDETGPDTFKTAFIYLFKKKNKEKIKKMVETGQTRTDVAWHIRLEKLKTREQKQLRD
jgi:hypothetical protein